MEVRFWGTRGSSPVSGARYVEFGGNTPCLQVGLESSPEVVILDAGTGIRELGIHLVRDQARYGKVLHLFLTHAHWDHIQGFPFFDPAYIPGYTLNIYCTKDARSFLDGQMKPPYFPVGLDIMRANITFRTIDPKTAVTVGKAVITNIPLPHPQGSTAFRVQEGQRSFVLATDTEHLKEGVNDELATFAHGTDALIYDAQYTPTEYESGKQGWGHSTFVEGVRLAQKAQVKRLYLFSHDPRHTDEDLLMIEAEAQKLLPSTVSARQGVKLAL